jgi:tagatose-1,6-bisphosphate aldolase non-catalytic subunit AgaZ/GatZ
MTMPEWTYHLKPGTRLRCVHQDDCGTLKVGREYTFHDRDPIFGMLRIEENLAFYHPYRFKPVVRVKAPTQYVCSHPKA